MNDEKMPNGVAYAIIFGLVLIPFSFLVTCDRMNADFYKTAQECIKAGKEWQTRGGGYNAICVEKITKPTQS